MTGGIRRGCAAVLLIAGLGLHGVAQAQIGPEPGTRIWTKLQQAQLLDPYYPDAVRQIAETLAQAAPGVWRGVQVNSSYRAGWLNIYLVDATRLRDEALLADEGVQNFTPEALRGGALAHEDTGIVFLNTAASKRLAAATVMKQTRVQSDLTAALAVVDAVGLQATRRFWDPSTLNAETDDMQRVGWLLTGAAAFILAHEMGHLRIGRSAGAEAAQVRLKELTERQKDERVACPETLPGGFQQQQRHETAADMAAVELLGQQCRLGGDLRHKIYMLGMNWYFLYAMGDKLLEMGRNTSSPFIEKALRTLIGNELYQRAIADSANSVRRGAVKLAFPKTHPPDYARILAIEQALRNTPCGGSGMDPSGAQMLEMFRVRMCSSLKQGAVPAALLVLVSQSPIGLAAAPNDAQFRAQYARQYDSIKSLAPDMVVEELRLRLEVVVSRGSQVGAASNDRRVRGFESTLLKRLQDALCPTGKARGSQEARPWAPVIDSVTAAASALQLRTADGDVAELTALTQRLIDSQQPARWCALKSLDDIR